MKINKDLIVEGTNYTLEDIPFEDVYSTTEVKTNKKWIDGKPIYRLVYMDNKAYAAKSAFHISLESYINPDTINQITHFECYTKRNNSSGKAGIFFSNRAHPSSWDYQSTAYLGMQSGKFSLTFETSTSSGTGSGIFAIIEYTKTTD